MKIARALPAMLLALSMSLSAVAAEPQHQCPKDKAAACRKDKSCCKDRKSCETKDKCSDTQNK